MRFIAPVAAVIAAALSAFSVDIQAIIMAHPSMAGIFAALGALAAAFAPSPKQ